jgi:formylglycine-generating enzyme required for sulfatase activity
MGTPIYMPPEQAEGRVSEMDARSDIYSLGAILYELLTLRPPYSGATGAEVLEAVRRGPPEPPSRVADSPGELDAVVMRAMARRKDDRFPDATQLHREIQLFLEGVKERERARKEAAVRASGGRKALARFRELRGAIEEQERRLLELKAKVKEWMPREAKKPLWLAETRLRVMRDERLEAWSDASFQFSQALASDAGCEEASAGICELFYDRLLEAEQARDRDEMVLQRSLLARYDRGGVWMKRLGAPGRLTVRAFAYGCGCLRARAPGTLRPRWSREPEVAWRNGGPAPGAAVGPTDRPVPSLVLEPPGAGFGHGPGCERREVPGVAVEAAPYEERERRLVPGAWRPLGATPIAGVDLPHGGWLLRLRWTDPEGAAREQRVPVRIERGGHWVQDVVLYSASEIPRGFEVVAAGPSLQGGSADGLQRREVREVRDVFVARLPVTVREFLAFLDDVAAREGLAAAMEFAPSSDGPMVELAPATGRFRLCRPDSEDRSLDAPINHIAWFAAVACTEWLSAREGRLLSLMHEVEFEKAARGVDGRVFPYGDLFDGSASHCSESLEGKARVMPAGSFPLDESPYGIVGLSGGMATWCLNAVEEPYRDYMALRGGAWSSSRVESHASQRQAYTPLSKTWITGLRLAMRPWAWPRA